MDIEMLHVTGNMCENIEDACRRACKLADSKGEPVEVTFNDLSFNIKPGDGFLLGVQMYRRMAHRIDEQYRRKHGIRVRPG